MKKTRNLLMVTGAAILLLTINACEEMDGDSLSDKALVTNPTDYTSILDLLDIGEVADFVEGENNLKSTTDTDVARCFEVTIHENGTDNFWPRSWTFSFADATCENYFGNTRLGYIHISLTDFWKNEGSLRTVTFEDYSVNGNKLNGTKTIKNTGVNDSGNLTFERTATDASFTIGDTATISWECNKNVEMIAGYETFLASDDEYLVSGSAAGINFDSLEYTIDITTPLHYKKCSRFPVAGSLEIKVAGMETVTIDYGTGECDDIALMTANGETAEIKLGENRLF